MANRTRNRAVIWDLDGVIADTNPFHRAAWQKLAPELGLTFTEEDLLRAIGGSDSDVAMKILGPDTPADEAEALAERTERLFRDLAEGNIKPLPGALPLLRSLKENGFRLALVSSLPPESIELVLSSLGIERLFEYLVSSRDVSKRKPNPEGFLLAARKLGVLPAFCVVIEDAVAGVEAAKAAGMKCVAVTTTYPRERLVAADTIVDSLEAVDSKDIALLFE